MPFETKSSWLFAIPQAAPLQASGAGRGQRSFLPRRAPGLGVGRPGGWAGERTLRRDGTLPLSRAAPAERHRGLSPGSQANVDQSICLARGTSPSGFNRKRRCWPERSSGKWSGSQNGHFGEGATSRFQGSGEKRVSGPRKASTGSVLGHDRDGFGLKGPHSEGRALPSFRTLRERPWLLAQRQQLGPQGSWEPAEVTG